MSTSKGSTSYDAFLLVSFGGPEGPDDVLPFLQNVTSGRNIPVERLELVAEHYKHRGGVSPINEHNRQLLAKIEPALVAAGLELPVYWGNRNWHPMLVDTVEQMAADGVGRAIAFVTSAFSSYSGCRQYRENLQVACEAVGAAAPQIEKLRVFYDHPGFIEPMIESVVAAFADVAGSGSVAAGDGEARLVFTAHSIPQSMAAGCDYEAQLAEACALVAVGAGVGAGDYDIVYQSRSGPPQVPWLEPDICDHIATLAEQNVPGVVVVPIGFVSDHMEVIQDLDTEAAAAAAEHGLAFARAATVGDDDRFVAMIIELIEERVRGAERRALGGLEVKPDVCAADCCLAPTRGRPPQTSPPAST